MRIADFNENKKPRLNLPSDPPGNPSPLLPYQNRIPRGPLWKIILIGLALVLIVGGIAVWKLNAIGTKIFGTHTSFLQQAGNLVTGNQAAAKLQGEDQGQINIVLLGYGGVGHDGPYLTDSIILASIRPADKKILLTSIPRDTYYQSDQGEKINAAFPSGFGTNGMPNRQNIESGGAAAEAAVGTISGEAVPYFVSIDFDGFAQAVNRIGGIEVDVQNSFTDDQYPNGDANANGPVCTAPQGDTTSHCRYIKVHFDAGLQTMNGQTALQFTRSRHASGVEGSDFARSKRQQLVLEAFKTKVESLNLFTNISALNDLVNILSDHLHTNLTLEQANYLAQVIREPGMQVVSQSLDPSTNLVCNAILPTDGAFVVQPCSGVTQSQIAQFFQNGYQTAPLRSEQATVIMENDGTSSLEYDKIKKSLTDAGATVYDVTYHGTLRTQSAIYTVTSKPNTQALLEQQLGIAALPLPPTMTAKSDFVVIIADGNSPAGKQ